MGIRLKLGFFILSFLCLELCKCTGAQNGVALQLWCVGKNNAADEAIQSALDWACGPGGADCGPIQQGGPCYDSKDLQKTASYAFNYYYLKHSMDDDACNFSNTAALTSLNPSYGNCKFPSSSTIKNGSISGTTMGAVVPVSADSNGSIQQMIAANTWFWPLAITFHLIIIIISTCSNNLYCIF